MKKIFITLIIALSTVAVYAQQDAMFTHYMFNTLSVNPAYAGSRDALSITGLHRSQWVGFDGAPTTQTLTVHSPVFNENLGVGLTVVNDKIGPVNTTAFYGDFAYKLKLNETSKLAFGLSAGLNVRQAGLTDVKLDDQTDNSFAHNASSDLLPNFGFGLYYSTSKYYVGLSTPRLLNNDFKTNNTEGGTNLASEKRHYFLIAGAVFNMSETLKFKPTTLVKVTKGSPVQLDLTATFIYQDKVWAGLMYRTEDAVGVMAGIYITPQLALGYSFDWSYGNKTLKYNGGSHEIMLMYDLNFKGKARIRSPRFF